MSAGDKKVKEAMEKIQKVQSNKILWEKMSDEVKRRIEVYKKDRNMERTWMHVDMDMFYAACEIRDRPDLTDKAFVVGDFSMV